ncbi:hypothetical protein LCGC14_1500890 [marine sediment metagenome]|uniref:Uncharacterized protein n=1 Tax=marine sediment metagenome TaxID=412755 RepID=A0A0F9J4N4_9ZZZZ
MWRSIVHCVNMGDEMSGLTVEQVEWLDNYLRSLGKPDSFGPHSYRHDARPIDLTYALIADWHCQMKLLTKIAYLDCSDDCPDRVVPYCMCVHQAKAGALAAIRKDKGPQR